MLRHGFADWGLLLALTVLWGSAFLLTKVAVGTFPPDLVVAGRLAIASLLLVPLALVFARRLPMSSRLWLFLVLIGLFGSALPFSLISWGQKFIDSGVAGILMAVMPLATLSLSHFLVPGERLTSYRIAGFVLGFVGVVILMGPEAMVQLVNGSGQLVPMLAVLGGAFCYAIAAILARLRPPSDALASASATTLLATFMIVPFVLLDPGLDDAALAPPPHAVAALVVLGVFSTALAAILYFRLIKSAGPAFVSQLNYLIPLWAVLIGVIFLGERPQPEHFAALGLILGGILLAQLERRFLQRRSRLRESGGAGMDHPPMTPPSALVMTTTEGRGGILGSKSGQRVAGSSKVEDRPNGG
jgi:drug/metabolite transporter (DMT)-like permease